MVKVAAVQVAATDDPDRNRSKVLRHLETAAERGARVVCFPELAPCPWLPREAGSDPAPWAEPLDGPLVEAVAGAAARLGVAVVLPFVERAAPGVYHNSAVVVDSGGERAGLYRKVHLPDIPLWAERRMFAPGDLGFPVFEVEGLRIGIQLGWDNFFPEGFRCLALAGAEAVFVPTAAAFASQERWLAVAVSHAVTNGLYVVRANRVGNEPGLDFYGHSFVVRPDGDLAAEPTGISEGMLFAELDPAGVAEARRTWPYLADRRPREYLRVVGARWEDVLARPGAGREQPERDERGSR